MIQILKMAFRDLGRNRRRSFFSSLALGMGLALLLLMASVINGEIEGSMATSIKLQSGHLQVRAKSYDENKTSLAWEDLIDNPDQVAAQVASLGPVQVATPRLFASGIVSARNQSVGVGIVGIEPDSTANAPYRDGLVSGEFLTADDRQGVLIGLPMAQKFDLKPGDTVNLLANTSNGTVDEQVFTIRGIFTTGVTGYDERTVFLPLAKAQALTQTENHASTIFVLLKDRNQTDAVAAALQSSGYKIITYTQANALLTQTEQYADAFMIVLYLIVLAITATVIVNTLVMSVFERTREIGILAALGMKGRSIMSMFFAESSLLAVGGIIMGLLIGAVMVYYASTYGFYIGNMGISGMIISDRIYALAAWNDTITLSITAFVVTLLAGLYPALLAARLEPVEALHSAQ